MPGSGGSYVYLREGYGREKWGRLAAFLFIWQFILSGPLEIASGYIGFAQYVGYLWPGLAGRGEFALRRRRGRRCSTSRCSTGRSAPSASSRSRSGSGTLLTTAAVIVTGRPPLRRRAAPSTSRPAPSTSPCGFLLGLGAASRVGIYDYLGYYDICYIGDEVKDPGRVIPRSILTQHRRRGPHLPRDQPVHHRRHPLAGVRARCRASRVRLHRLDLHGEDLRARRWPRSSPAWCCGPPSAPSSRCCSATRASPTPPPRTATSSASSAASTPPRASPTSRCS